MKVTTKTIKGKKVLVVRTTPVSGCKRSVFAPRHVEAGKFDVKDGKLIRTDLLNP